MSNDTIQPQSIPLGAQPVQKIPPSPMERKDIEKAGAEKAKALWSRHAEENEQALKDLGAGVTDAEKELRSHLMWRRHFIADKVDALSR